MGEAIETYELRGGYRVTVEHDPDAANPRTEYDGGVLRLVPLEVLNGGRASRHLESLGFDDADELDNLRDAWERLGGESGERFEIRDAAPIVSGSPWTIVPGWEALRDFGRTPVARWARIFHGVELEIIDAGENRAVAWIDLELCGQYGAPVPEDRAGALAMIEREVAPYNAWAAGEVFGVVIEDKHGAELGACWGLYLDPFDEAEVLEAASGYAGGKVDRWISERLEHVRELDALRTRLRRAEALARWERLRAEALEIVTRSDVRVKLSERFAAVLGEIEAGRVTPREAREAVVKLAARDADMLTRQQRERLDEARARVLELSR